MLKRMSIVAVCTVVLFFGVNNFLRAQKSAGEGRDVTLEAMRLEGVEIEAQSIGQLFSQLSLSHNIPIGLEIALNDDELADYYLDFSRGTLSDLLTQFVEQHKQYAWEVKDGVVKRFSERQLPR